MRFISSKYFFFLILIIDMGVFAFIAWLLIGMAYVNADKQITFLIIAVVSSIFPLLTFTASRQLISIITINKQGVKASVFGIPIARIKWQEMAEVGIGTHNDMVLAYAWIYFSKKPLTRDERIHMQGIKGNNDSIKIRFSKKALRAVEKYYHGDIKNLRDDMKGQFPASKL